MRREVVDTINTKRQKIRRFYYIDMAAALDDSRDRMDAIVGVPEAKIESRNFGTEIVRDLTTPEQEYALCMFPTNRIFDWNDWQTGFVAHWGYESEKTQFWFRFLNDVLLAFHQYQMPVIELGRRTSREAVCLVFEKVNTGGKKLDAFELLTAIYAGEEEGFHLRDEWTAIQKTLAGTLQLRDHPLTRLEATDFFQALALLQTRARLLAHVSDGRPGDPPAISCTRDTLLGLPLSAYKTHTKRLVEGFQRAGKFLFSQHLYWFKDVPYRTQIVPLAAIIAELGERWEHEAVRAKLARWYWCGVFGELYGSAIESRFAKDISEVITWIDGGPEPTTIRDANFRDERLNTMTSRLSAAYKGVHALLMKEGARDFRSGQRFDHTSYFDEGVDIHHIFPRAWCEKNGIARAAYDTIINKTPISYKTNRTIGGDAPSAYLARLPKQGAASPEDIDAHLRSHLIDPELLRADSFEAFISARREALLKLIETAMGGKGVFRNVTPDEPEGETVTADDDDGSE